MAKTGVTSNIPKAMREFDKLNEIMLKETQNLEATLSAQAMREVGIKGLIKGSFQKKNPRQYDNIEVYHKNNIYYQPKSQKYRTKDLKRYKYYGKVRNRERRYSPRDRGPIRVKVKFNSARIAVRTGDFWEIFSVSKKYLNFKKVAEGRLVQNRKKSKITVESFDLNKTKQTKSIRFDFYGTEGKSLRMLSYGTKRKQPLKIDGGKQLKGRKGKRDVVANAIRKTMNRHNKLLTKYIQSDYKKRFDRIK